MKFKSETERLAHPLARLIPELLFDEEFDNTISEQQLELMGAPMAAMTARIDDLKNHSPEDKLLYWFCIALGHPKAKARELIHLANTLNISTTVLFNNAARIGRLNVINLLTVAPVDELNPINSSFHKAVLEAAQGGEIPIIEHLTRSLTSKISLVSDGVLNLIRGSDNTYTAFVNAAEGGHLAVMEKLMALAPDEVQNMVKAGCYIAFREAARRGHLAVLERLIALAPAEVQNMIKAWDFGAFYGAAQGGHLAVIERLIALAPTEVQNMIRALNYYSFRSAAMGGHLSTMDKLIDIAPTEVLNMIRADDYDAFCKAAFCGHFHVLDRLIALALMERLIVHEPAAPNDVLNMIKAGDYRAFRAAASMGSLQTMERLMSLAPTEVLNMVKSGDFGYFLSAAREGHLSVTNRLLAFSAVMAHAEMHEREFGDITHPFISNKLALLRMQRLAVETDNPHAVFDITDAEEAKCCFYIIRNLIRRNDPTLSAHIRFLLEIPAVKALAHLEVTEGQSNELIRLAIAIGNEAAANTLLTISAVRDLVVHHNYYREEAHGVLDLRVLARDRESSMHALSTGEQKQLAAVIERYQPKMLEEGTDKLFADLRKEIISRYHLNPATISIDGVKVALPVDWEVFNCIKLTPAQRTEALKAYYIHKDHSALRYLSHPNHWMSPDASYVYINDERTQRWSTFEEYKPLIIMLWLAAKDETIPPTDGHTLEGRITHFIDELAQIGRAHNWDQSRSRVNTSGHAIDEEYDDLTGDKPSCFSGMKRRLFQSVIGHPLLKILTEQDIKQELRDFVRTHFNSQINDENRATLLAAWNSYCVSIELPDAKPLRVLDISAEQQAAFIQQLTAKYGHQFSGDAKFRSIIDSAFKLVESTTNPSDCMHALKFDGLVNLKSLLQASPIVKAVAGFSTSTVGFFSVPAEQISGVGAAKLAIAQIGL